MRKFIGIALLVAAVAYAAYEIRSGDVGATTSMGILAMIVAGGIMLRRGRQSAFDIEMADLANPTFPKDSKLPVIDLDSTVEEDLRAVAAKPSEPPTMKRVEQAPKVIVASEAPTAAATPAPQAKVLPPPTPRQRAKAEEAVEAALKSRTGMRLVVSDGRRTDVRDFRRRIVSK